MRSPLKIPTNSRPTEAVTNRDVALEYATEQLRAKFAIVSAREAIEVSI